MSVILRRITKRTGKGEGGQSLVEFTLVLPIFLLVLFAIIDFGMAFNAWITVTNSAREGARAGIVGKPASDIEARVRETASALDQDELLVTITNAEGASGESVVVNVSYTYTLITPVANILGIVSEGTVDIDDGFTLSSTADMRLE
jgi:Flp pilus assembly protein TadG